jgi:hypothetical protein
MKNLYEKWLALWARLPAEIKVAVYLALSYGVSEVIIQLGKVEVSNVWLVIVVNIVIVFLKNLKPRYDSRKEE